MKLAEANSEQNPSGRHVGASAGRSLSHVSLSFDHGGFDLSLSLSLKRLGFKWKLKEVWE